MQTQQTGPCSYFLSNLNPLSFEMELSESSSFPKSKIAPGSSKLTHTQFHGSLTPPGPLRHLRGILSFTIVRFIVFSFHFDLIFSYWRANFPVFYLRHNRFADSISYRRWSPSIPMHFCGPFEHIGGYQHSDVNCHRDWTRLPVIPNAKFGENGQISIS